MPSQAMRDCYRVADLASDSQALHIISRTSLHSPQCAHTKQNAIAKSSLPALLVNRSLVYSLSAIAATAKLVSVQPNARKYGPRSSVYGP